MEDVIGHRAYARLDAGRQCSATSKSTGERCKRAPIVGGFVCPMHGGAIPAVQKSARERLLAMVDPALDALLRFLRTAPPCTGCGHVNENGEACVGCGRSDGDRDPTVLRAAQIVLDRTGYHPSLTLETKPAPNPYEDLTTEQLIERLEVMLAEARNMRDAELQRSLPQREVLLLDAYEVPEGDEIWSIPPKETTKEPSNG